MTAVDESKPFVPLNIAVATISDTRSISDDKSGLTLAERILAAGHHLATHAISLPDDIERIEPS